MKTNSVLFWCPHQILKNSSKQKFTDTGQRFGRFEAHSGQDSTCHGFRFRIQLMSTLTEIEQAADVLPSDQKRKLAWFLLTRLRAEVDSYLPPVRDISKEQIEKWIAQDDADYSNFLAGK